MTEAIASLRLDWRGCVGALMSPEGALIAVERALHPAPEVVGPFLGVESAKIIGALHQVCLALARHEATPAALALTTTGPTSLFIGSENRHLTPVLFGEGLPLKQRQVPAAFRENARAMAVYRRSVVRQAEELWPELSLELMRLSTLGALAVHWLTGEWQDNAGLCPPGMPYDRIDQRYSFDEVAWTAAGIDRSVVAAGVKPGGVMGQLLRTRARELGWPADLPVFATADSFGCASYGLKSDAAGWCVDLGEQLCGGWTGASPLREGAIQIDLAPKAQPQAPPEGPLSPEEASVAVWNAIGDDDGEHLPGPQHGSSSFRFLRSGESLAAPGALALDAEERLGSASFVPAPVGAEGLRYFPGRWTGALVGLRHGHRLPFVRRAIFEGLLLELRRLRMDAGVAGAAPPRIILGPPWGGSLAPLVVEILGEPAMFWEGEPEVPSLLGQALAVGRALGWTPSPRLSLPVLSPVSQVYDMAFDLYRYVRAEIHKVLL